MMMSDQQLPIMLNTSAYTSLNSLSKPCSPCPEVVQEGPPSERLEQPESNMVNPKIKKSSKKNRKRKHRIIFNVSDTKYEVVRFVGEQIFRWKLSYDAGGKWDVFWTDYAVHPETLAKMLPYQKINHFPGMYCLARKNHLGKHLMRLRRAFPEAYSFFPKTYLLPSEYTEFRAQFAGKSSTYIVKPEASCQGRGIFLTRTCESVQPGEHYVVQKYLSKPYLIDGLKFDLRVYVLLAGCDPLRIYVYNDGLARFATEKYMHPSGKNLDNICMHLTNYAVNKGNPNFVFNASEENDNEGHKRSLKGLMKTLEDQGHDVKTLWKEIKKLIIKTFCSVQPILAHNYRACQSDEPYNNMCFEILGFDIMLDHKLKPYLLEVNHTPSFTTDTPLDRNIKKNVIHDALKLMNISAESKHKYQKKKKIEFKKRVLTGKITKLTPEERRADIERAQKERDDWENQNLGGFEKAYPIEDPDQADEDYEIYLKEAIKWWEGWTGVAVKRFEKRSNSDVATVPTSTFNQVSPTNRQNSAFNSTRETHSSSTQYPLKPRKPIYSARPSSFHLHSTNSSLKGDVTLEHNVPHLAGNDLTLHWLEKEEAGASLFEDPKEDETSIRIAPDLQQGIDRILDHKSIIEEDFEESDHDCQGEDEDDDEDDEEEDYEENRFEFKRVFEHKRKDSASGMEGSETDSFETKADQARPQGKKSQEPEKSSFFRIRTQSYVLPKDPSYKSLSKDTTKIQIANYLEQLSSSKPSKPLTFNKPETTQLSNPCLTEINIYEKYESHRQTVADTQKRPVTRPVLFDFEKEKGFLGKIQTQSQSYRGKQTITVKVSPKAISSAAPSPKSQPQFWNYFASKAIELKAKNPEPNEQPKEAKGLWAGQAYRPGSRIYVKRNIVTPKTLTLGNFNLGEQNFKSYQQLSPQTTAIIKRK